jgi:hypothetical protein
MPIQQSPYNVYGSKNHAHIQTNTLIYLNSINYDRSILPIDHQVIYSNNDILIIIRTMC